VEIQSPLINGQVHCDRIIHFDLYIAVYCLDLDVLRIDGHIVLLRFFQDGRADLFRSLPGRRREPRDRLHAILKLEIIDQRRSYLDRDINKGH